MSSTKSSPIGSPEDYRALYERSITDPDAFWGEQARERLTWDRPFHAVSDADLKTGSIAWFLGGALNTCYNCVDRHVPTRGDQVAILWEGDDPADVRKITYRELQRDVSRMANVLRRHGVRKGDRVAIYLPMIPAAAVAMPLFILYTSGSTGKPKGVVHTSGGYLVYAAMTHQYTFDYHEGDVFWCTADVGWVTGHSYIIYGPLANGATTVMFEGVPTYPDAGRFWEVCEKHSVNQFYTAPTAIRLLMGQPDEFVTKYDLSSLKLLGSVGEPINPEAWNWYNEVVGQGRCPIVDTWWQTETGGHLITPLPGATRLKPGSATVPFFGVQPVLLDATSGEEIHETAAEGVLCMKDSWPGQMRTLWGDPERFVSAYFSDYKGYYFTGDGCRRDEDGYYWITGRVDDVINVSGHRMGTAEVESALVAHDAVAEAAVVGFPHDLKGQGIYCYVTLMTDETPSPELVKELQTWVRKEIGPIAKPDAIQFAPGLPKTRSGKIMRRILRKIAENDFGSLGDTSTLADPSVVDALVEARMALPDECLTLAGCFD
jgi:acetyl-CoA synthetase